MPVRQNTGITVAFMKMEQDVHIARERLTNAVNEGVRQGYEQGYSRKFVMRDPIERINTKDNTPVVIHCEITDGKQVDITTAPKGFGSESMNRVFMLKPVDGLEGVRESILQAVREAGPNARPPMVVGVGIGGTFERYAQTTRRALTRDVEDRPEKQRVRELEEDMLKRINQSGIGPRGLGGRATAFAVSVETFVTHIVGPFLAVSIYCHVNRHTHRVL